jgi:hypothetical protein
MIMATPSVSALNLLYGSFSSVAQPAVVSFLNKPGGLAVETRYAKMQTDIDAWLSSSQPKSALGVGSTVEITGLRVQVVLADGLTVYDSGSGDRNIFTNIGKPKSVPFDGKYMINENQNTRTYNMGASLSQSGVFSQLKHSTSTGETQLYLAIRQGLSSSEPLGNIIISMDA